MQGTGIASSRRFADEDRGVEFTHGVSLSPQEWELWMSPDKAIRKIDDCAGWKLVEQAIRCPGDQSATRSHATDRTPGSFELSPGSQAIRSPSDAQSGCQRWIVVGDAFSCSSTVTPVPRDRSGRYVVLHPRRVEPRVCRMML